MHHKKYDQPFGKPESEVVIDSLSTQTLLAPASGAVVQFWHFMGGIVSPPRI